MLTTENISKYYGTQQVLNNINLNVNKGDFTVIMGPSGSGKTTLLNILAAIDRQTKGRVLLNDEELIKLSAKKLEKLRQEKMGFIFQEFHLLNTLNAQENIVLPLTIQKYTQKEIDYLLAEMSEKLQLHDVLEKYPPFMSGGEKQRVAAVRALITKPEILFADEPTGALDSKNAFDLLTLLEQSNTNDQQTIVMVTHDPFSASFAERVLFIKDGMIFHTLEKGDVERKTFFEQIIQVTTMMGGTFNVI